jgi:probable HAF family extracellular repeat protein
MKFKKCSVVVMSLFAALAIPVCMAAQDNPSQDHKSKHHQYKLIDLGTFGGPSSFVSTPSAKVLNNRGMVAGWAETPIPDPYAPNCLDPDCFVPHAFQWQNGILTDLGTLAAGTGSFAAWINERGMVVGCSENGLIDPLTGYPELDAVAWEEGQIVNLGTLGGNQSCTAAINNRDEIVGGALNAIADPYSYGITENFVYFAPAATQTRAALWKNGAIQDLGTLGGNDAVAVIANDRGQVAGLSYTNSIPNPVTGLPTLDPFIWEKGTMTDLGTLGGTAGWPWFLNDSGQVVGQSNLADDVHFHAFLWERGVLKDLGTLGGNNSSPRWVNDAGEIVGRADLYPGLITRHGFLWKNGVMTDLGVVGSDPCSTAYAINSSEQIVGDSSPCGGSLHGFLWENGGPIVDLQTLVLPGSDVTILETDYINDAGEISGLGKNSSGDTRAILLIHCDEHHPGQCEDYSMIEAPTQQTSPSTTMKHSSESPADTNYSSRDRFGRGFHLPGQPAAPRD